MTITQVHTAISARHIARKEEKQSSFSLLLWQMESFKSQREQMTIVYGAFTAFYHRINRIITSK